MELSRKPTWQERVVAVHIYHQERLRLDKSWSYRDTAKELNLSVGTICQDVQLAQFLNSYEELHRFKNLVDALEWVKRKKIYLKMRGK